MKTKFLPKRKMVNSSLRVSVNDLNLLRAAVLKEGVSVSEFLRRKIGGSEFYDSAVIRQRILSGEG